MHDILEKITQDDYDTIAVTVQSRGPWRDLISSVTDLKDGGRIADGSEHCQLMLAVEWWILWLGILRNLFMIRT